METPRYYNIAVNADLVEMINPDLIDWNDYHQIMHNILEIEYMLKITGFPTPAVRGRGHAGRVGDFW